MQIFIENLCSEQVGRILIWLEFNLLSIQRFPLNPQVVYTRLFCEVLSGEDTKSPIPHPQYTNYYFPLQYQTLARRLLPARSRDSVSFSEINSLISAHMAGLLLPSNIISGEEGEEVTSQLIELDQVRTKMLQCLQYFNTSCNLLEFLQNSHKLSRFIIQDPVVKTFSQFLIRWWSTWSHTQDTNYWPRGWCQLLVTTAENSPTLHGRC